MQVVEKKEIKIVGIEKIFILRDDQFSFLVEDPNTVNDYAIATYRIWDKKLKISKDVPKGEKCWAILVEGASAWIKEVHIDSLDRFVGVLLS